MFVLVLVILVLFPSEAQEGAREGLKVAFETVIPSVVPFAVAVSALVYSGLLQKVTGLLLPTQKRCRINPYGLTALFCSFLGGYPTGCTLVCDMYKAQLIDKDEAERMLAYANNGGLIFALNICGRKALGGIGKGWAVVAVSVLSAFAVAMLMGRGEAEIKPFKKEKLPVMAVFGKAVASGGGVILNITASFVVFYAMANAIGLYRVPFFEGVFEMTKGIMYAGKINSLPLAVFYFTLGGVGVFAQSAAIVSECDLSLKWCIKGKITSALIAFIFTYLVCGNAFTAKDIILFSFAAVVAVVCAIRIIKKLYAEA